MSSQQIDQELQKQLRELLMEGDLSFRAIGRELGISDSTVRKYAELFGVEVFQRAANTKEPFAVMGRQIARQRDELTALRKHVRTVNDRGFGYDDFMDTLRSFYETEALKPAAFYPTSVKQHKPLTPVVPVDSDHREMVVLALSDWHLTETVREEDSNGVNKYNTIIAANRLFSIVEKAKRIIAMHRAMYKIDKIVLLVLGDLISGSIHDEHIISNDATDQVAQILGMRLLEMVIAELQVLGLPIEVHCVVGNHPRTSKRVPTKNIAHTNLEWVVYEAVGHIFNTVRKDSKVTVHVHTSQWKDIDIFGHRYIIEHGIGWKNESEEKFESALRDLIDDQIYRSATGLKGASFDQIVIGDRHKPKFLERTVVNGSLIGQNELGQNWRLKPIRAQQLMWGVSRSYDRTFQYGLDVTGQRATKVLNPFSDFANAYLKGHGKYSTL